MLSVEALYRLPVFEPRGSRRQTKGVDAQAAPALRRIGRVHFPVFSPDGRRLVGLLVSRPDVAGMVKREDVFCAWDRVSTCDRGLLVEGDAALDDAAKERLGLDWDHCIIWSGMDVATRSGKAMGRVADLEVDPEGRISRILVTDGDWAESFVGAVPVTMDLVLGVAGHRMIVADEVDSLELTGGWMAAAGRGYGTAKVKAGEALSKAGATAGTLMDKGSFALGRALGHAKRSIQEALADDEDEAEEKPARADEAVAPAPEDAASVDEAVAPTPGTVVETVETEADGTVRAVVEVEMADGPETVGAAVADAQANVKTEVKADAKPAPASKPEPASKPRAKGDYASDDPLAGVAKAFGRQLGKTQGMFSEFLREFKENSK